ncbi:hypothetical protein, partial [Mesorhizobium sp. M0019]|uniref:hypothetical protein n=1 Tax=Mesorhizobium sp. M0019 TaxID=2956845 RepID=UPI00333BB5D4
EPQSQRTTVDQQAHRLPQAPLPRERLSPAIYSGRSDREVATTDLGHELSTGGVCTERGKIRCSA